MTCSVQEILFLQNKIAYERDEKAYKKLFLHFYSSLFKFSYNIVKNEAVAEEIVSDVMMQVWAMDNKLANVHKLNVYLLTAIKNASIRHISKNDNRYVEIENVFDDEMIDELKENPESRFIYTELQLRIENAIQKLPRQCQLIYRLIREEGLSHKEVIATLEISQNTIETQMRIALKKIRTTLDEYLTAKK